MTASTQPAPLDLDALEKLCQVAAPGPWLIEINEKSACSHVRGRISRKDEIRSSDGTGLIARIDCALEPDAVMFSPMDGESVANAALIAAVRNALPALLAEARENRTSRDRIAELERENAELRVQLSGDLIDRAALSSELTYLWTLRSRLKSRSRTETYYPNSQAPELLRRCEEAIEELEDALRRAVRLVSQPHGAKAADHG